MDKIEKIHIARVIYSIEPKAEKNLKDYLRDVKANLELDTADEVIDDIESRIPEILAERKVNPNDVITDMDVNAIKKQLGSPEQFLDNVDFEKTSPSTRKLYRDGDRAVIGGVASGISQYFNIDPIFVRIAFIILIFFWGIGLIVYLLLWAVVPSAKTGSDKLQMSGLPVTAAQLQKYRSGVKDRLGNGHDLFEMIVIKTLRVILVVFTTGLALLGLTSLGILSGFTYVYPFRPIFDSYRLDYILLGVLWVVCISLIGLLITVTLRLWGRKTKQIKISAIVFITTLVIALAGSGSLGLVVSNHFTNKYGDGKTATALAVDNLTPTMTPTSLKIESGVNLNINYVVTDQNIHANYEAWPGLSKPNITITNDNGLLSVNSSNLSQATPQCFGNLCQHIYLPIRVTLYGPAVSAIIVNNGATLWLNNDNFGNTLSVTATDTSLVNVINSYANTMTLTASNWGNIQTNNTSAEVAYINVDGTSSVNAPATPTLNATIPGNCNQQGPVLFLNDFSGGVTINKHLQSIENLDQNSCLSTNF